MKVKVCGNSEVKTLQALIQLPIDFIGFIFAEGSSRQVTQDEANILSASIETGPTTVGVFQNSALEDVTHTATACRLGAVQLHGDEDPLYITSLRAQLPEGTAIWKAIAISHESDMETTQEYIGLVDQFLFDAKVRDGAETITGGTGEKFSWEMLGHYKGKTPYMLAGGISPRDAILLREVKKIQPLLSGIDLNSQFEKEPGVKDIETVKAFLEELRA